jgi:hypothetical protein
MWSPHVPIKHNMLHQNTTNGNPKQHLQNTKVASYICSFALHSDIQAKTALELGKIYRYTALINAQYMYAVHKS